MAVAAIWAPALVFAHLFAFFWLFKALVLTRPRQKTNKQKETASSSSDHLAASPAKSQAVLKQSQPVLLEWQALGCSYSLHGSPTKVVLHDVWGQAAPGQMQALMGPSGAGKSTLMDMLARRKSVGNLTGRLLVNGRPATSSFIAHTSYVPQDDTFIPTQTSQETLTFYASVTLGAGWSRSARKDRVAKVLKAVGLGHATDTLVGGMLPGGLHLRGLSGGERKRLSIAAGLLGRPSVVYLDEPTSGLDSFAALVVMGHLQRLAQSAQQTVIATIHQPRSDIWDMFDKVSLLSAGRLMFHGACADLLPWFTSLGYVHTRGSASDWVLDLVATGFTKPEHLLGDTMCTKNDVDAAADAFKAHCIKVGSVNSGKAALNNDMRIMDTTDVDCQLRDQSSCSDDASVNISSQSHPDLTVDCEVGSGQMRCFEDDNGGGRQAKSLDHSSNSTSRSTYPTSWWAQFTALVVRELTAATRNPFDVAARVLTCAYMALACGLLAYDADFASAQGLQSRSNYLFGSVLIMLMLPYISISLYTNDKTIYLADVSAKSYRPSAYYLAKILVTLPFNLISTLCFSAIFYGMSGLNPGWPQFGRFTCIVSIFFLISHQVLHLCATISPNFDVCFVLSVCWGALQELWCSFFISFSIIGARMQWLTQLRYIAASYFALEALMVNEHTGRYMDCSNGLAPSQVDTLTAGLVNTSAARKGILASLKSPQPGCVFREEVLLANMGFGRPFGQSVGILLGYLGVVHVLTYAGLLLTARRERR